MLAIGCFFRNQSGFGYEVMNRGRYLHKPLFLLVPWFVSPQTKKEISVREDTNRGWEWSVMPVLFMPASLIRHLILFCPR